MYIIADVKNDTSPDGNPSSRGVSRIIIIIIIISRGTATCDGYPAYTYIKRAPLPTRRVTNRRTMTGRARACGCHAVAKQIF